MILYSLLVLSRGVLMVLYSLLVLSRGVLLVLSRSHLLVLYRGLIRLTWTSVLHVLLFLLNLLIQIVMNHILVSIVEGLRLLHSLHSLSNLLSILGHSINLWLLLGLVYKEGNLQNLLFGYRDYFVHGLEIDDGFKLDKFFVWILKVHLDLLFPFLVHGFNFKSLETKRFEILQALWPEVCKVNVFGNMRSLVAHFEKLTMLILGHLLNGFICLLGFSLSYLRRLLFCVFSLSLRRLLRVCLAVL
jgi:hypothetical protein